jgi:uroporphyrinogen decarboxylase
MFPFLEARLRNETEYTPIWFMRQAGRYLPRYRRLKGTMSVMEMAKNPALSSQLVADAVKELESMRT